MKKYRAAITRIGEIAEGTFEVRTRKPEGFFYEAGQFVMLELPQMGEIPGPEKTRAMSMASAPSEDELIFVMRIPENPSTFKRKLKTLKEGDEVLIEGPAGHFTLPPGDVTPVVFIAGGIGIAPFRGMIVEELHSESPRPITLLYANRTIEQATYFEELKTVGLPHYHFAPTLTRSSEKEARKHSCEQGYITEEMIKGVVSDPQKVEFYIVGTKELVQSMKELLLSMGVEKEKISLEMYPGY